MHKRGQNLKSLNCLNIPSLFRKLFGLRIQQILDPVSILLPQMDFLKDMILVMRLITLLGGIVVFTNPQLFSSHVSNLTQQSYHLSHKNVVQCYQTDFAHLVPGVKLDLL